MHRWHRTHDMSLVGLAFNFLGGEIRYWSAGDVIDVATVEALDEARECERVALEVHRRFGFRVCVGWAASDSHNPVMHFWNLTDRGEVVDAANARRRATGYLGKVLEADELDILSRLPFNRSRPSLAAAA